MKKVRLILLVDDSEADNYFHSLVIEKSACVEKVVAKDSGPAALEYLKSTDINGDYPQPDIIFLDINMPGMDGWTFLDEYDQLLDKQKGVIVVVMLTTSRNPDDKEKANDIPDVADFRTKPLTDSMLKEIVKRYLEVDCGPS
ncbi:MAG: response regulator [Bacteroidota bacterium]